MTKNKLSHWEYKRMEKCLFSGFIKSYAIIQPISATATINFINREFSIKTFNFNMSLGIEWNGDEIETIVKFMKPHIDLLIVGNKLWIQLV